MQVLFQAGEVEPNSLFVEVPVATNFKAGILEDGGVVAPRWDGKVDNFGFRIVPGEEGTSNTESPSARDRLSDSDLNESQVYILRTRRSSALTAFWSKGTLSGPYASLAASLLNSGRPVMGRYSLSGEEAVKMDSACAHRRVQYLSDWQKTRYAPF